MTIPCHDPAALSAYCLPFIHGDATPETAEELMASRYVAYTLCEVDYLIATADPEHQGETDRRAIEEWSRSANWLGLEILETVDGKAEHDTGEVEFIARFSVEGREQTHHEHSTFKRIAGRWHFIKGRQVSR